MAGLTLVLLIAGQVPGGQCGMVIALFSPWNEFLFLLVQRQKGNGNETAQGN